MTVRHLLLGVVMGCPLFVNSMITDNYVIPPVPKNSVNNQVKPVNPTYKQPRIKNHKAY